MFIDSHAHLYLPQFEEDRLEIIQRCLDNKVDKIFLPNIDLKTIDSLHDLCEQFPDTCFAMMGLHPCSVQANYLDVLDQLYQKFSERDYCAVGEIGIDLYWDKTFQKEQEAAFRIQINWAKEMKLPFVIHSRDSIEHTIRIVSEEQDGTLTGIFHCFSDDINVANEIMDLGFLIGIGGVATFKKSEELRQTIQQIPLSSIVLETDAPYLTPTPFRGKRNESSYIPYIAQTVAQCKSLDVEQVAQETSRNALKLFK